jgi:hypothetical protein
LFAASEAGCICFEVSGNSGSWSGLNAPWEHGGGIESCATGPDQVNIGAPQTAVGTAEDEPAGGREAMGDDTALAQSLMLMLMLMLDKAWFLAEGMLKLGGIYLRYVLEGITSRNSRQTSNVQETLATLWSLEKTGEVKVAGKQGVASSGPKERRRLCITTAAAAYNESKQEVEVAEFRETTPVHRP